MRLVIVKLYGTANRMANIFDAGLVKADAVAAFVAKINYRIAQAAGTPYNRAGAVTQRIQLVKAAGLNPRRHQQKVGTGVNQVGQRLIVTNEDVALLAVKIFQVK